MSVLAKTISKDIEIAMFYPFFYLPFKPVVNMYLLCMVFNIVYFTLYFSLSSVVLFLIIFYILNVFIVYWSELLESAKKIQNYREKKSSSWR